MRVIGDGRDFRKEEKLLEQIRKERGAYIFPKHLIKKHLIEAFNRNKHLIKKSKHLIEAFNQSI